MSRFVNREAFDMITMKNGDTVKVRQKLTAPEQAAVEGRLFHMEYDADSKKTVLTSEWHFQKLEVCRAYIIDSDFKGDDGNPVEYTLEALNTVDDATVSEIAEAIDGLVTARKEGTEKNAPKRLPK